MSNYTRANGPLYTDAKGELIGTRQDWDNTPDGYDTKLIKVRAANTDGFYHILEDLEEQTAVIVEYEYSDKSEYPCDHATASENSGDYRTFVDLSMSKFKMLSDFMSVLSYETGLTWNAKQMMLSPRDFIAKDFSVGKVETDDFVLHWTTTTTIT